MSESNYKYIWRCPKCSYHFVNISKLSGSLQQEKKCPKCKSLNALTLTDKEITLQCRYQADSSEEIREEEYPY